MSKWTAQPESLLCALGYGDGRRIVAFFHLLPERDQRSLVRRVASVEIAGDPRADAPHHAGPSRVTDAQSVRNGGAA